MGMDLYLLDLPSWTTWTLLGWCVGLAANVIVREGIKIYKRQTGKLITSLFFFICMNLLYDL